MTSTASAPGTTYSLYRAGKSRSHPEGVAVHVWLGDDVKYCTVYGGSEREARMRAERMVWMLNNGVE